MFAVAKAGGRLVRACVCIALLTSLDEGFLGQAWASIVNLSNKSSGYSAGPEHWREFLACWNKERVAHYLMLRKADPDLPNFSVISTFPPTASDGEAKYRSEIDLLQRSLGVTLPKSYTDFLIAYQPRTLVPQKAPGSPVMIGMYSPAQVDRVSKLAPELLRAATKYSLDSSDNEYFVYGKDQDVMAGRTRNLSDAIVVGKYGSALFEIIALYPQVRTADGEMEAMLGFHAGEFRAPSFAELMRQLSVLETRALGHVPPYSQDKLRGTCADRLRIENPWWK